VRKRFGFGGSDVFVKGLHGVSEDVVCHMFSVCAVCSYAVGSSYGVLNFKLLLYE
jgi:hypothetical protein